MKTITKNDQPGTGVTDDRNELLVADFDYELPPGLIAQHPLSRRDRSRMMVVDRKKGTILHRRFSDMLEYFGPADLLVMNNTRVMPVRLFGKADGSILEFLLFRERPDKIWEALCRPAKKARPGRIINFDGGLQAEVTEAGQEGVRILKFSAADVRGELRRIGFAPLPLYIKRKPSDTGLRATDLVRYQTVFAGREGAVAAPTAGLHFTKEVIDKLKKAKARLAMVTLDVGPATFQPVRTEAVQEHRMLEESFEVSAEAAAEINAAKAEGRRVTAIGTTVVRTIESSWQNGAVSPGCGSTSLFIYPGYEFKVIDRLLTNFHMPRSTLLMLVSAFAGKELIFEAYREAVHERYRFFSYGDCMLIL